MKKRFKITIALLVLILFIVIKANPLIPIVFNEFMIESNGWSMELSTLFGGNDLNGWFLTTSTDTVYFKDGISFSQELIVMTPDSMKSSLYINPSGDRIEYHDPNGNVIDYLAFGSIAGSMIAAPQYGRSICAAYNTNNGDIIHYFDNTPTMGEMNDTSNTRGYTEGFVLDSLGLPLDSAEVVYDYYDDWMFSGDISVFTDSTGYFIFRDYARRMNLKIRKKNFDSVYYPIQVWPDSIVRIDTVILHQIIVSVENEPVNPAAFELYQNYPNPFNPATTIKYRIHPAGEYRNMSVRMEVYNVLGKKIRTLVDEEKIPGVYETEFDGDNLSSGVYLYRIIAGKFVDVKKMVLLR